MARVPFIAHEDASSEVQALYDAQEKHLGRVLTTTKVRAHCPELLRGIAGLQASQEQSGMAPAELKPLLTLLVSRLNECPH